MKPSLLLLALSFGALALSSCVPLAAGAAGGYIMAEEGVEFQSPVKTN
ncbi:hypothetical protein [Roseibacillus persicicus]|nr:hypothetical protein [Roseibacillus persicicus]MDQ8189266.1 hypothetical protein [Roseibacillus persicicus]